MEPALSITEIGNNWFYFKIDDGERTLQEYYRDTPEEKEVGRKAILKRYSDILKEEELEALRINKKANEKK